MFRRRPLRRPPAHLLRPRPGFPSPVAPRLREALVGAHQALERGDADQAAQVFRRLAKAFASRGMPLRAAGMLLQAAYAEAMGGEAGQAVEHAARALDVFACGPLPERVAASAERLVTALRHGGHEAEAARVEQMVEEALERADTTRGELAARFSAARARRRGTLPAKCSSCGGPLLPDEVAWHDDDTAECPYCGVPVKAQ
jgi:predicted Zn-ribbon and HTH transcriptional regulator